MKLATHQLPGLSVTDHEFAVPLDYAAPGAEQIRVFAREVVAAGRADDDLPWLVFLQGGPGFPAPRPMGSQGWVKRALQDYRLLLLDQRGTGRSTPVTYQTLARFSAPEAAAGYLQHFRADAIVADCEWIRRALLGADEPWSVLGQSYGGFCAVRYLSAAPQGLREVLTTGGLPPLSAPPDEVYRATYRRVLAKNRRYYERYPDDAALARRIADHLAAHDVPLPGGGRLTPRRFQMLGMGFGASDGFETLHYLLEEAFVDGASGPEIGYGFLRQVENLQSFETNPIYAILHEAIYCQGEASRWSAERVRAEYPAFDLAASGPVQFTGEMIYPWMFDEFARLQPLKAAAESLAAYDGWPRLYDVDALRRNTVPVAAAVYYDDMYVERGFSEAAAETIGGARAWVTNEYEHNGLRADGEHVLGRLIAMVRGEV